MARDSFQCQRCDATDKTLNVHHKKYMRGREPWEYPDDMLVTFCEDCHKAHHPEKKRNPLRPLNLKALGFVITWTAFPDNDIPAWEILEWTGVTMRKGHPEKNEIYECMDRRGRTFWIDQSDGRFFKRPINSELKFDSEGEIFEVFSPPTDKMVMMYLSAMLDGIQHDADFEDGRPNGPRA